MKKQTHTGYPVLSAACSDMFRTHATGPCPRREQTWKACPCPIPARCIHAYIHKPEKHPFFNLFINFPTSLYGVGSWKAPWIQASISVSDSKKSSCDSVIHQSATYESIQSAVWIRNGKKATETVSGCGVSIFLSKLSKSGTKFRNAFCSPISSLTSGKRDTTCSHISIWTGSALRILLSYLCIRAVLGSGITTLSNATKV